MAQKDNDVYKDHLDGQLARGAQAAGQHNLNKNAQRKSSRNALNVTSVENYFGKCAL